MLFDSIYGAQIASGFATGFLVAPIVTIVDQAIVTHAAGRENMLLSMKRQSREMVTRPMRFIAAPSFRWVAGVFCFTYASANVAEEYCSRREELKESASRIKFAASSSVNIPISALKDRAMANMFSSAAAVGDAVRAVPKTSIALFGLRDGLTVGSSFALPQKIAPYIQSHFEVSESTAMTAAMITAPLAAQIVSTPLFLLGLDLANHDTSVGRMGRMAKLYVPTLLARWARVLPAFSVGGCANKTIRDELVCRARQSTWRPVTTLKLFNA
jgi:hypothetical protein